MENLFSTNLSIDNKNVSYHVFFDKEKYTFEPEVKEEPFPAFSFKREHDEWHEQGAVSPQLKQQAISALEKYLLAQH
jgi:hypothetical protein